MKTLLLILLMSLFLAADKYAPTDKIDNKVIALQQQIVKLKDDTAKNWEASPEYKGLKTEVDAKKRLLEDRRVNGTTQDKMDASASYNLSKAKLEKAAKAFGTTSKDAIARLENDLVKAKRINSPPPSVTRSLRPRRLTYRTALN